MFIEEKLQDLTAKVKKRVKYYAHTKSVARHNNSHQVAEINLGTFLLNKDGGRYSFIFCQFIKFSGFNVVVRLEPRYFLSEQPYKRMLLDQDFTKVRRSAVPNNSIILHGRDGKKKYIKFVYGYHLLEDKIDAYYLPYTLHPKFYQTYKDSSDFKVFREADRRTRIIFSGNFERNLYDNKVLKRDFSWAITRVDVLDYIKLTYEQDSRVYYSRTPQDLFDSLAQASSKEKFVIAETKSNPEDWLKILGCGDFYLCLPGMGMPWSHNAFEAMAVGTIPILQYNALFYPALVHMKNCLVYDSFETLKEAIEIALTMPLNDIRRMKAEVISYYEEYIATEQVIKQINAFLNSERETLNIAVPFLNEHKLANS